jgi:hypothetical protein
MLKLSVSLVWQNLRAIQSFTVDTWRHRLRHGRASTALTALSPPAEHHLMLARTPAATFFLFLLVSILALLPGCKRAKTDKAVRPR